MRTTIGFIAAPKKNPGTKPGLQAYLLSHIKAPLREEKRKVANHPERNLANIAVCFKRQSQLFVNQETMQPQKLMPTEGPSDKSI
jgi:hypothetical protein